MRSMTGFASVSGVCHDEGVESTWRWDLRSVNGRGLEARFRTPPGWDRCETTWRAVAQRFCQRGSVSLSLTWSTGERARSTRVNSQALAQVIDAAEVVRGELTARGAPPATLSIDGLLALKGVLEADAADTPSTGVESGPSEAAIAAASEGLERALIELATARAAEGARLRETLSGQVDQIETHVAAAAVIAEERAAGAKERLRVRVSALMEAGAEVGEERLAQEMALLAVKLDVREEIDRLRAHIEAARSLISAEQAVGRKLDFLSQEFNREANTLCSKSQDTALTETGLALKVVIDQLREQSANVE